MSWDVILGLGVQTALFVLAGYAMVLKNDWSNKALAKQLEVMEDELKKLNTVITQIAVQDVRIDNLTGLVVTMQRELSDLRRGRGWIESGEEGKR
jgi:hypothetical protein